jgi:hypothetical protein
VEGRLRRGLSIAVALSAACLYMAFPALGDQVPQPDPTLKACSTAPPQTSGMDYRQQDCFFVAGGTANAAVAVESVTPAAAVPQSNGSPSTQKFTKASAAAPGPVCGYVPLTPDELKAPWAWAGAAEAATWTTKPGRFPMAPVSYYKTGIPDSMKDLGFSRLGTSATDTEGLFTVWRLRHLAGRPGRSPPQRPPTPPNVPLQRWKRRSACRASASA